MFTLRVFTKSFWLFFTEMGTVDSAHSLQSRELDGGKQGPVGSGWPGPEVTWNYSGCHKVQVTTHEDGFYGLEAMLAI